MALFHLIVFNSRNEPYQVELFSDFRFLSSFVLGRLDRDLEITFHFSTTIFKTQELEPVLSMK